MRPVQEFRLTEWFWLCFQNLQVLILGGLSAYSAWKEYLRGEAPGWVRIGAIALCALLFLLGLWNTLRMPVLVQVGEDWAEFRTLVGRYKIAAADLQELLEFKQPKRLPDFEFRRENGHLRLVRLTPPDLPYVAFKKSRLLLPSHYYAQYKEMATALQNVAARSGEGTS